MRRDQRQQLESLSLDDALLNCCNCQPRSTGVRRLPPTAIQKRVRKQKSEQQSGDSKFRRLLSTLCSSSYNESEMAVEEHKGQQRLRGLHPNSSQTATSGFLWARSIMNVINRPSRPDVLVTSSRRRVESSFNRRIDSQLDIDCAGNLLNLDEETLCLASDQQHMNES